MRWHGGRVMTIEGLTWIVAANGAIQLLGFAALILRQRRIMRMITAVAAFVHQEEQKTRILLKDLQGGGGNA
jgi:hypothetical protein